MIANLIKRVGSVPVNAPTEHIVVLCQDRCVRDLTAAWATQAGLNVDVVTSGLAARKCLAKHFHCRQTLITDRVFPPWPGLISIARLKRDVRDLRVIVVQNEGTDAAAIAAAAGADAGITHPVERAALVNVLGLRSRLD
ncbi:MAG: hypothetical protein JSS20_06085 [Proteobacteria bacterium]|nr:hypothetical protein [Pseudomonadota bacterium]